MKHEQTNIAALLRDCHKGAELWSPICGNCTLEDVSTYNDIIEVRPCNDKNCVFAFNSYGIHAKGGECLLFPSKDNRDWTTFHVLRIEQQPKFDFGDVVKSGATLYIVDDDYHEENNHLHVSISTANAAGVYRRATPEEIAKWNEQTLHSSHLHYSRSKRKLIHWFLPFDKVVVRDPGFGWNADFFSFVNRTNLSNSRFVCVGSAWEKCLPYNEKTAKLIGTLDDYEEEEE